MKFTPVPPKSRNVGFTLIELLIVVAIIAILAAIAVPNFLEAQTRSKVSRTKADMRTLATALEAYFVDENKYPPDYSDAAIGKGTPPWRYNTLLGRLTHLTSPVSYVTSLPTDIFAVQLVNAPSVQRPDGGTLPTTPYREGSVSGGDVLFPIVYDYAKFDRQNSEPPAPGIPRNDREDIWAEITASPGSVQWALNSPGPDIKIHVYLGYNDFTIYDPTNGTISAGQIIRTSLGADDMPQNL